MQRESSTKRFRSRLHKEDVDVACIQETHLNTNHRFFIRGYQTFRLDREGRHKGGVLILVQNNIAASDFKVGTNQQAEIHGIKITVDNSAINIFNLYCPPWQRRLPSTYTCAITKLPGCWWLQQPLNALGLWRDWLQRRRSGGLADRKQHASAEWSRRPTNFLLATLDLNVYSRLGLCNWRPVPKNQPEGPEPAGRQRSQTSTTGNQLAVQAQQPKDLSQMGLQEGRLGDVLSPYKWVLQDS